MQNWSKDLSLCSRLLEHKTDKKKNEYAEISMEGDPLTLFMEAKCFCLEGKSL